MKITSVTTEATTPMWAGSVGNRDTLLSGGAKLLGSAFPLVNGARTVPSGTLVSRDITVPNSEFGVFDASHGEFGFVWITVTDTSAKPDVEVYVGGEVRVDRLPVALTAPQVAAIKTRFRLTTGGA